ncbi:MAG: DUF494 family protein [Candidatus Glassbacteria bacterium]|nr:DUF494 family protein [Candidatus Glassbacteria bacterium]
MQNNVEEIISYMNENFSSYEIFERQVRRVTRELMELGYTLEEITRGINAYLVQLEPKSSDRPRGAGRTGSQRTFRVLDTAERRFIGRDAYGYLCLIRELGLVNHDETEELIGYITSNRIEVDNSEQLQAVMMELLIDPEYDRDCGDDDENVGGGESWHMFRKRLN